GRFLIGFVAGEHRPAAHIVADFIRREVAPRHRATGLETDDLESGLRERQHGDATSGAKSDDDDVGILESSRHAPSPSPSRGGPPSDHPTNRVTANRLEQSPW